MIKFPNKVIIKNCYYCSLLFKDYLCILNTHIKHLFFDYTISIQYSLPSLLRNKSDDYLFLSVRNLENSSLNPVFRYTISICIYVGMQRILNNHLICFEENDKSYLKAKNSLQTTRISSFWKKSDAKMYIELTKKKVFVKCSCHYFDTF